MKSERSIVRLVNCQNFNNVTTKKGQMDPVKETYSKPEEWNSLVLINIFSPFRTFCRHQEISKTHSVNKHCAINMADSQTSSMRNFFENLNKKEEIELNHVNGKWKPTSGELTSGDKNNYTRNGPRPKTDAGESTVGQNASSENQTSEKQDFGDENGINNKNDEHDAEASTKEATGDKTNDKEETDADKFTDGDKETPNNQTGHEVNALPAKNDDDSTTAGGNETPKKDNDMAKSQNEGNEANTGSEEGLNGGTAEDEKTTQQEVDKENNCQDENGSQETNSAHEGGAGDAVASENQTVLKRKDFFEKNSDGLNDLSALASTGHFTGNENHGCENGPNSTADTDDIGKGMAGTSSTRPVEEGSQPYDNETSRKKDSVYDYIRCANDDSLTVSEAQEIREERRYKSRRGNRSTVGYYDYERIIAERRILEDSHKGYLMLNRRVLYCIVAFAIIICVLAIIALIVAAVYVSKKDN